MEEVTGVWCQYNLVQEDLSTWADEMSTYQVSYLFSVGIVLPNPLCDKYGIVSVYPTLTFGAVPIEVMCFLQVYLRLVDILSTGRAAGAGQVRFPSCSWGTRRWVIQRIEFSVSTQPILPTNRYLPMQTCQHRISNAVICNPLRIDRL